MTPNALMELADRADKLSARLSQHDSEQSLIWAVEAKDIATQLRTAAAEGGEAVYATVTGLTSEGGKHELYTITDEPFPLSDPWKLYLRPPTDSGAGRDGMVIVPKEVRELYDFMVMAFAPFTSQQEQIAISLKKAKAAMKDAIAGAAGESS